jgi:purine-cytosine permease-like protein
MATKEFYINLCQGGVLGLAFASTAEQWLPSIDARLVRMGLMSILAVLVIWLSLSRNSKKTRV